MLRRHLDVVLAWIAISAAVIGLCGYAYGQCSQGCAYFYEGYPRVLTTYCTEWRPQAAFNGAWAVSTETDVDGNTHATNTYYYYIEDCLDDCDEPTMRPSTGTFSTYATPYDGPYTNQQYWYCCGSCT